MNNLHIISRSLAAGLVRRVLRHNPHLLAQNHFLAMRQQWQDDIDTADLPPVRLVYGAAGATGANKTKGKTADSAHIYTKAV